ncbi:MAG TPA: peptidylprolyl isomerase [Thermodesulfobacteriota bacterium]|nr:peptidylprolyl isomerase [Thermodesulfobacteriota bacterium]
MQKIRTTIITGLIIMITGICYATEVIDRIVAVVNDDLITLSDLNRYISSIPPGTAEIDRDRVLNDLVEQMILEQEAAKLGITVSDPEIDMSIENIRTKAGMSHEQMEEMLKKENLTKEQFRKQWRLQIISGKLVNSIVKGRVAVTDDEIENLYKEYYGNIENSDEVQIAHILISVNEQQPERALEKASRIAELAKSGNDFSKLVAEYSDDTFSKEKEGVLGYFKKGELVSELEAVVAITEVGEVSGPVQTASGFHIIKVLNRNTLDSNSVDTYREQLRQEIYKKKVAEELQKYIATMRENAYIEIKL